MSAELDALVKVMPFAQHLGVTLEEASPQRVTARLEWAPHLCTAAGLMHGGVLMSLADTAGALVTYLGLPEGATTATITSTSQLFRPVTGGVVRAVATPLHWGRTTVTAQTSLYDAEQRLVAQTTQIQAVRSLVLSGRFLTSCPGIRSASCDVCSACHTQYGALVTRYVDFTP